MSGRKEISADYKAQRSSRPDLLKQQWPHLQPLVEAFGYPNVSVEGYEADDVIAALTEQARADGIPVMVVTGDRDAYQLVTDGVRIMTTSRGITDTKVYDRQGVIDRYGIPPELVPDFIGLKGDTSDNIPGVPGIGDKTAAELLQRFGSLEEVLANVDQISGAKRKQNLTEFAEDARVSKRLATMVRDVPVELDLAAELTRERDRSRLRAIFRDFELRDPLRRLEEALDAAESAAIPRPEAETARKVAVRKGGAADLAEADRRRAGDRRHGARARRGRAAAARDRLALRRLRRRAARARRRGRRPRRARRGRRRPPGDRARRQGARRGPGEPDLGHRGRRLPARPRAPRLPARRAVRGARHGGRRRRSRGGRAPCWPTSWPARQREQVRERGLEDLLREIELPLVHVLRETEKAGIKLDTRAARAGRAEHARRRRRARARDLGAGRRGVHDRLAAAARRGAVRQARPVAQAPRQDRLLDRRARAAGDPRRAPDRGEDRALARGDEARPDLPGAAAGRDRPRRPPAHDAAADQHVDGPARVDQPEPAEHPDPHGDRARDPRLLHRRARQPC